MLRKIFLSYAREDIQRVQMIAQALTEEGFEVWWDHELMGGDIWPDELNHQLNTADTIVVVWSENAIKSEYVCAEANAGLKRRLLVPVLLERCEIPQIFAEINAIDLSDWHGGRRYGRFRKLVLSIEQQFEHEDDLDAVGGHLNDLESLYDEVDMDDELRRAEDGDPEAQLTVGIAYQHGIGGFDEDAARAHRWMERAAKQGHEPAFSALGWLYYSGALGQIDAPKALKWFRHAADVGDAAAAWEISQIYTFGGGGIRKNLKVARRYCQLAADLGDKKAIEMLDQW